MAVFAKTMATIWSTESGSPERRSYVRSEWIVSMPVRPFSSAARISATLALWRWPKASGSPTSAMLPPSQMAPSAVMTKA